MSDVETLKEFLVQLGFKVDEPGYKKFSGGVARATTAVASLGAATVAAGAVVATFVDKVSEGLEKLYFVSQRTGASVENIKSFGFAMGQMGSSVEGAQQSLENLANFIRSNPGSTRFLGTLGVDPAHIKDASKTLDDLSKSFRQMPYYRAKVYASFLGIDENTLRAMISSVDDFSKKYHEAYKKAGIDADQAALASHNFMNSLRELWMHISIVAEKLALALQPATQHFITFAERIIDGLMTIGDYFSSMSPQWKAFFVLFAGAIAIVFAPLTTLAALFLTIIDDFETFKEGGKSFLPWVKIIDTAKWALTAVKNELSAIVEMFANSAFGRWLSAKLGISFTAASPAANDTAPSNSSGIRAMEFFQKMGWTKNQAAGITANLGRESGFKSNAVGDHGAAYGVAQWHKDRQEAFKQWSGKDIRESSFEEQLAFVHHELTNGSEKFAGALLRSSKTAASAGAAFSRFYERPGDMFKEATLRGSAAERWASQATINQSTTIHVNSNDPQAAGRAVAAEQSHVNDMLLRNTKGAIR